MHIAGIEIGGTKCICTLATPNGDVIEQVRVSTRDPATTLGDIDRILEDWQRRRLIFGAIGIASFGPVELHAQSPAFGSIVSTPKRGWSGTKLAGRYARFGVPVGFEIDVIGAAKAERRWGAAQGLDDFTYITVGTGIGVGPIVGGRSILGRGHCEMGHMRIPRLAGDDWPGACPYHGDCVEGLASGAAIRARHGPGEIAPDWRGWIGVEHALALLIHNLFVSLQPQAILVGGGVVERNPWLLDRVAHGAIESLSDYYTAAELDVRIVAPPGLGEMAGPLGAIAVGADAIGL